MASELVLASLLTPSPTGAGDDPALARLEDDRLLVDPAYTGSTGNTVDWAVTAAEVRAGYRPRFRSTTISPATAPTVAPTGTRHGDGPVAGVDGDGPVTAEAGGGLSGEVIAWLAGLGILLVVWCAAWRRRPGGGRIVVRQTDDPLRPPCDRADDPGPVRIEL